MNSLELDFGETRRQDAQVAMRSVVGSLAKDHTYTGSRLATLMPQFDDAAAAGKWFTDALEAFLRGLGAEVQRMEEYQALPLTVAPEEILIISGTVPGNALEAGFSAMAPIIEAAAEVVRVMLGTAIVAAFEEAVTDERVLVVIRSLEAGAKVDLETQRTTGLVRFQGIVVCEREQRASYLLGACAGQPKRQQVAWAFPFVEMIYGANRLRWQDLRSPGYDAERTVEQQTSAVPS